MHRISFLILVVTLIVSAGCATTRTQLPEVAPDLVRAEQAKQRALFLQSQYDHQRHLDDLGWPIAHAAADLCSDKVRTAFGLRLLSAFQFEDEWRTAAREGLDLGDHATVISVSAGSPADEAGIEEGDVITSVAGRVITPGEDAVEDALRLLQEHATATALEITWRRAEEEMSAELVGKPFCGRDMLVMNEFALNAFADGENVYLTSAMMRFAEDDELRAIIGHEIAHNAMGHIEAMKKNSLLGAIIGVVADVGMAAAGYNTGGAYTAQFAELGAMRFSQDFEREADYVGLYLVGRTGSALEATTQLWRHMAQANPDVIGFASSHPTSAERFVRMEQAIAEIETKIANGLALTPEMKPDPE